MVVVLPAPLGPTRPSTSPCANEKETSLTTVALPKVLVMFWTLTVSIFPLYGTILSQRTPAVGLAQLVVVVKRTVQTKKEHCYLATSAFPLEGAFISYECYLSLNLLNFWPQCRFKSWGRGSNMDPVPGS